MKALVMGRLREVLGGDVPVVSKRPDLASGEQPAPSFVVVVAAGGPGRTQRILQESNVTVDCYATSTGLARDLAATVDEAVLSMREDSPGVTGASGTDPAEYPDPDTKSPRFTATYQLTGKRKATS
jgi:hypothetical protein